MKKETKEKPEEDSLKRDQVKERKKKKEKIEEKAEDTAEDSAASEKPEEELREEAGKTEEKKSKTKDKKKDPAEAVVNVYTSFNNTLVHVTDMSGKTLAKVTGGMVTKHGRLKANPTIAMFIAKRVAEKLKEIGVGNLFFRIRAKTRNPAPGPGANAIIKSLSREGFKILNILDTTRFPRGGPKKKGGRRGRRP